eukprot:5433964-Alexandrium_andersonii.AAC.1
MSPSCEPRHVRRARRAVVLPQPPPVSFLGCLCAGRLPPLAPVRFRRVPSWCVPGAFRAVCPWCVPGAFRAVRP